MKSRLFFRFLIAFRQNADIIVAVAFIMAFLSIVTLCVLADLLLADGSYEIVGNICMVVLVVGLFVGIVGEFGRMLLNWTIKGKV